METYRKRGFLNSDFRLFHLTDATGQDFEPHYHDFDKIIIFVNGLVDYVIEGKSYRLKPYDIVLVNHNDIHRPEVSPDSPYERIIVYLSPGFLDSYKTGDCDLSVCFRLAKRNHSSVLRIPSFKKSCLYQTVSNLERACSSQDYANELYCRVLFLEFMIHLNRAVQSGSLEYLNPGTSNPRVAGLTDYINSHLSEDLTVEGLAETFYISKYYLMRLFKQETGCTLGVYIAQKRLLAARERLLDGASATQACFECGFKNYSAFSRSYKSFLGETPRETRKKAGVS